MTEQEALAKAKTLWGQEAYVLDRDSAFDCLGALAKHYGRFYVGNPSQGYDFPYGNGNSWEEAFQNVKRA